MDKVTTSEKTITLEDILAEFKIFGRFHMQTGLFIFVGFFINTLHYNNYVFAAENIEYRCINNSDNTVNSSSISDCTEWLYENPYSMVAEFNLGGQEWKRTLVGTIHCFGYMIGLLIVGSFSDSFGRKNAVVITATLGGVFGLAKSFSPWYWLYIALEFLEATFGDSYLPTYILMNEIVSKNRRIKYSSLCKLGSAFSGIALAMVAEFVTSWRTFLRIIYAPALLLCTYKIFLDESPRWLLIKGDKRKATEILTAAAKKNKLQLSVKLLDGLTVDNGKMMRFSDAIKSSFQSKKLRTRMVTCFVWWFTSAFVCHGLVINSVFLSGSKYVNYAVMYAFKIPGLLIITYICIYCQRKVPLMCCFFAGAILCVSQPFVPSNLPWLSVMIYVIGHMVSYLYFYITYLYTTELFPTCTRNTMQALCSSFGRIGSMIAPQTPLLISYWSGLPSMIFGLTSLFAGLVTLFSPDVSNDALPDTVEQAEAIGGKKLKTSNTEFISNSVLLRDFDKEIKIIHTLRSV